MADNFKSAKKDHYEHAPTAAHPHVLLLVETSLAYGRGIVEGIARYALENGPWSVQFEARGLDSLPPKWLKNWRGDGIISRTISLKAAKMLKATQLPLVEMLGSPKIGVAQVRGDFEVMAQDGRRPFSRQRVAAIRLLLLREIRLHQGTSRRFSQESCRSGDSTAMLSTRPVVKEIVPHWDERQRPSVAKWLRSLPRPIGIYTPGDSHAVRLLDICRELRHRRARGNGDSRRRQRPGDLRDASSHAVEHGSRRQAHRLRSGAAAGPEDGRRASRTKRSSFRRATSRSANRPT